MTPRDLAEAFLRKAQEDLKGLRLLASDPGIADALIGFHAQQCVEKALKAILTAVGVRIEWTHDLAALLDMLLQDGRIEPPDWLRQVAGLSPYAVEWRYAELESNQALDRPATETLVARTLEWARARVEEISPS
jgi:HEPN domain-containing protein